MAVMPSACCAVVVAAKNCPNVVAQPCFTKISEAKASEGIDPLAKGGSVRSTARLAKVCHETVARLLRVSGRHAEGGPDQHVHDLTPRALAFDEQRAYVKKAKALC
jgi:hypothetical protein